jgi:co-chaperonin GroES (HSP10)
MRATGKNLIIRRAEAQTETAGGILLPASTADAQRPYEGDVLEVGPEVNAVKIGDRVAYTPHAGREIMLGGKKLTVLLEDDVLVVL